MVDPLAGSGDIAFDPAPGRRGCRGAIALVSTIIFRALEPRCPDAALCRLRPFFGKDVGEAVSTISSSPACFDDRRPEVLAPDPAHRHDAAIGVVIHARAGDPFALDARLQPGCGHLAPTLAAFGAAADRNSVG